LDALANFCTLNGDLDERLFYRACASPRFYTAKTQSRRNRRGRLPAAQARRDGLHCAEELSSMGVGSCAAAAAEISGSLFIVEF
jgi:hypothetical protein